MYPEYGKNSVLPFILDVKNDKQKYEAMLRRELYTKSKTAGTEVEREEARKAYLDKVGMHQNFRW